MPCGCFEDRENKGWGPQDEDAGSWLTSPENIEPAEDVRPPWSGAVGGARLEALYDSALQHSMATAARREGSPADLPERDWSSALQCPPPFQVLHCSDSTP